MSTKKSGYIVETKDGKKGRTFHSKGIINDKIPVYLETSPFQYATQAILCDPKTLKLRGFID
jgi:hypothetical protein